MERIERIQDCHTIWSSQSAYFSRQPVHARTTHRFDARPHWFGRRRSRRGQTGRFQIRHLVGTGRILGWWCGVTGLAATQYWRHAVLLVCRAANFVLGHWIDGTRVDCQRHCNVERDSVCRRQCVRNGPYLPSRGRPFCVRVPVRFAH